MRDKVVTPDSRQFVRVEFSRSLVNIKPGESRHPWIWCIIVQDGHLYAIGGGKDTLVEAVQQFHEIGVDKVMEAEKRLASMYTDPHQVPYDMAVRNPDNKETA